MARHTLRRVGQVALGIALVISLVQMVPFAGPVADSASARVSPVQLPGSSFGLGGFNGRITVPTVPEVSAPQFGTSSIIDGRWTEMVKLTQPGGRRGHVLASFFETDKTLLFGGYVGGNYRYDTWVYDLSDNEWTRMYPPDRPSGRHSHAMATIHGTDKVLLFGGYAVNGLSNETWLYDLSDNVWVGLTPLGGPTAREYHDMAMVYDDDKVVLFSGYLGSGYSSDTWMFDLSDFAWYSMNPHDAPSARKGHEMATVHGTDKIILFGGNVSGTRVVNDTWVYDLSDNAWTDLAPASDKPTARRGHTMASLYETDLILLFGNDHQTWVYDFSDNMWVEQSPPEFPSPRYIAHGMASVYFDDKVVLFGGGFFDTQWNDYNDTWVYDLETLA